MPTVKISYTTLSALTITLDSLASGSSRQSALLDNSVSLYDDILLGFAATTPAAGTLAAGSPNVTYYVAALMDGTHYADGCTGSDGAFTPPGQINSVQCAVIGVGTSAQVLGAILTAYGGPVSVAALFGGQVPQKLVVWATNNLGVATGTGNAVAAIGVLYTSA